MLLVFVVVERSPIVWTTREGGPEELVVAEGEGVSMEGFGIGGVVGPILVDIAITGMSNREDSGVDRRIGVSGSIRGGDRSIWDKRSSESTNLVIGVTMMAVGGRSP